MKLAFKTVLEVDFMRLEYTNGKEKQFRIAEIEAILTNEEKEQSIRQLSLEVELQFLQDNTNSYGEPIAYVGIDTGETLEIIFDENIKQYSMIIHDAEGNPMLPYYNAKNICLFKQFGWMEKMNIVLLPILKTWKKCHYTILNVPFVDIMTVYKQWKKIITHH